VQGAFGSFCARCTRSSGAGGQNLVWKSRRKNQRSALGRESQQRGQAVIDVGEREDGLTPFPFLNDTALRFTQRKDWCSKSEPVLAAGGVALVNGRNVLYPTRIERAQ
jgi:hypothetical protein